MRPTPISHELIDKTIDEFGIKDFSRATIREVKAIATNAENASVLSLSRWRWEYRVCNRLLLE